MSMWPLVLLWCEVAAGSSDGRNPSSSECRHPQESVPQAWRRPWLGWQLALATANADGAVPGPQAAVVARTIVHIGQKMNLCMTAPGWVCSRWRPGTPSP